MMASAILYLASDFAVTALVQDKVVVSRCPFGTGLVVTQTPENISQVPPQNAAPYWAVTQAQTTSQTNGGLTGIYAKANKDLNFSADETDVFGGWICQANTTVLEYPSDTLPSDIVNDIVGHGLLYGSSPPNCDSGYGPGGYAHLITWDSSVADLAQMPFNVRASIDLTGGGSDTKVMQSFECRLNGTALDGILSTILSKSTLVSWCAALQGRVYNGRFTPATNDTGSVLEETLNSMVMVAGGNNYLLNTTAANETQGCLVVRTNIHLVVVILTSLDTLIAISMIVYCLILILLVWRSKKTKTTNEEKDFVKSVEKFTPGDVFGWMAQAVREGHIEHADVEPKCLKEWELGLGPGKAGLRVSRRGDEELPVLRMPTGSGKAEGEQNGHNTDPPDKGLTRALIEPEGRGSANGQSTNNEVPTNA